MPFASQPMHACGIERMDGMWIDGDASTFVYGMKTGVGKSYKEEKRN